MDHPHLPSPPPPRAEIPEQKNNGRRKSESGGGSGGDSLGQKSKRDEERNPDVDPRLRVMERFQEFLSQAKKMTSRAQRD